METLSFFNIWSYIHFTICTPQVKYFFFLGIAYNFWDMGHALKLSELSNGLGGGPDFKNTVHSYSFLTFGMKIPLYGQIIKTVSMLEAALSPEGSPIKGAPSAVHQSWDWSQHASDPKL